MPSGTATGKYNTTHNWLSIPEKRPAYNALDIPKAILIYYNIPVR